jgi:prepilin-type N-terminal cleavage/methylation domain-containing protein
MDDSSSVPRLSSLVLRPPFLSLRTSDFQHRRGFTLTEVLITMSIICILVTLSTPMYSRAVEQARLDAAARDLQTVWTAQRVYWLEERSYAPDLATLYSMDLLGSKLVLTEGSLTAPYVFSIESSDSDSFTAVATRNASHKWSGEIQIDEFGDMTGGISASNGTLLVPMLAE